jgi:hypothetical protein
MLRAWWNSPELRARDALFGVADGVNRDFPVAADRLAVITLVITAALAVCPRRPRADTGAGRSRPVRLAGRVAPRRSRFRGPTVFRKSEAGGRFSAFADIEAGWVVRQQCGRLLTMAASSNPTAASCISELTLSTQCRRFLVRCVNVSYQGQRSFSVRRSDKSTANKTSRHNSTEMTFGRYPTAP